MEQRYRRYGSGQRFRPLCELGGVVSRGCSRRLQRALSDFGADESFHQAPAKLHGVGDGAPWIAEQVEAQFGAQGHYLVDFYHVCEYLAAAAPACGPSDSAGWRSSRRG